MQQDAQAEIAEPAALSRQAAQALAHLSVASANAIMSSEAKAFLTDISGVVVSAIQTVGGRLDVQPDPDAG